MNVRTNCWYATYQCFVLYTKYEVKEMPKLTIDKEKCKGCGLCTGVCPKKILEVSKETTNSKGYFVLEEKDPAKCIGCAFCAMMCPDCVIKVEK